MRIAMSGKIGDDTGFFWALNHPANDDIDADNDGVLAPSPEFIIDLSRVAARALGYQASMMSAYKLHRVKVGIRPVDDIDDNDFYASFGIRLDMYPATEHALTALRLAKKVEDADESNQIDSDGLFLRLDDRYTGFRYGWSPNHTSPVHTTGNSIAGMASDWTLSEIFNAYDLMTDEDKGRALFGGRAPEMTYLQTVASWTSGTEADAATGFSPYYCQDDNVQTNLKILPLIRGRVMYSTADEPGSIDDDYTVHVELEFTPEVGGGF